MKKCWWPLSDISGSVPVASVYSVTFSLYVNAVKQKSLLTVTVISSSVGTSLYGIRCVTVYHIFGVEYVTLSSGVALVLLIPLREGLHPFFLLLEIFPGTYVPIWISWTVILIVNNFQSPWLLLLLVGKIFSGTYILVGSDFTGSCARYLLHATRSDAASILGPICPLLIVLGAHLWGWWVGATVQWLGCILMLGQACFCNIPGTHPCQTLLGNQRCKSFAWR